MKYPENFDIPFTFFEPHGFKFCCFLENATNSKFLVLLENFQNRLPFEEEANPRTTVRKTPEKSKHWFFKEFKETTFDTIL